MKKYCFYIFLVLFTACQTTDSFDFEETSRTSRRSEKQEETIEEKNQHVSIDEEDIEEDEEDFEFNHSQVLTRIEYVEKEKIVEIPVQEFINNNVAGVKDLKTKSNMIKSNNHNATMGLSVGNFKNAEVHYNYIPGYIYPVHVTIPNVTCIELEKGEILESYFLGDQTAFTINNEVVNNTAVLYLCGLINDAATNLIVTTNKRRYLINLKENCNQMNVIKWNYGIDFNKNSLIVTDQREVRTEPVVKESFVTAPKEPVKSVDFENTVLKKEGENKTSYSPEFAQMQKVNYVRKNDLVTAGLLENLNHNYRIKYKTTRNFKPKWYPQFVFSDGFKTYIFIPNLANSPTRPVIFATDRRSRTFNVVNYRINGLYYIIDSVDDYYILTSEIESKNETVFIEKRWR